MFSPVCLSSNREQAGVHLGERVKVSNYWLKMVLVPVHLKILVNEVGGEGDVGVQSH